MPRYVNLYRLKYSSLVLLLAAGLCPQQDQAQDGTRQLYYLETGPKETLPPIAPASTTPIPPAKSQVKHLGLHYNVVLVDASGHRRPISSERVLQAGDCFAIDLHSNRSGYVYVFAKQSSGSWIPLLPSAEMPDESNILDPERTLQVPKGHCFEVRNPPGDETLFVVLSRNPSDFYELYENFKSGANGTGNHSAPQHLQFAEASRLDAAVEHLDQRFGTRDIAITKVQTSHDNAEPVGSVYVVNTSSRPTSSIVTTIIVRHR